jgi:glycosyltransferase involved in cell wall biosynthesis
MASQTEPVEVCVIAPGPPSVPGGVERCAARFVDYVRGWGVSCIPIVPARARFAGSHRRGLGRSLSRALGRVAWGLAGPWKAFEYSPRVVHVHGAEYGWGMDLAWRATAMSSGWGRDRPRPTIVVTCHGSLQAGLRALRKDGLHLRDRALAATLAPGWSMLESRLPRAADVVIAVSSRVAEEVRILNGVDDAKVIVIPNCVDDAFFGQAGAFEAREPLMVWVGRNEPSKRFEPLLPILERVKEVHPPARLATVGAQMTRVPEGMEVHERLSPHELAGLLGRARLLVSTSTYEADPLTVKEALACGTPALVTPAASAAVRDGENGIVCSAPLSTEEGHREFARQALRLLCDNVLWRRLSEGASRSSVEFSRNREEARYRAVYESLLGRRL